MPLQLTEDNRIDLQALECEASTVMMREWMYARFTGADSLLPLDADSLETPDEVFIDIWRRADMGSRVRHTLEEACVQLLRNAWESHPSEWMRPLLHLVAAIRPLRCRPFLESIVRHGRFRNDALKEDRYDELWLQAAASYGHSELVAVWRDLLQEPDYTVIAYRALSRNLATGVCYLAKYYEALPIQERSVLLREAIRDLLDHGIDRAQGALDRARSRLEAVPGLSKAVDEVLQSLGQPVLGTICSNGSYLEGLAAIKPAA